MEALVGYLVAATKHRAALMVFEDAHWIDPTSHEVLDQLIDRIANLPMLLIVTYRPEFTAPWSTRAYATTIMLNALARAAAAEMVEQIAGRVMPEAVCSQIIDRADGVPLFIEEVTRAAVEVGGDAVPRSALLPSASVPTTLYASLTARLDRLGATARQVAQAGAAIGREFEHDLVAAIAGLPDDALGCALRWLEDAQLIHRRGAPPEATYSFRHVLLRDAAYSILLRESRRALHTRIAEAIMRLRPEAAEREPQLLALHYTMAGLAEEAIGYWRLAGERSVAQFANREAIGHFERALELVEALPPGANRDRLEADLRLAQVAPLMAIHGVGSQAVEACAARVKALGDRLADWPGAFAARKVVWHTCLMRQPVPRALALAHHLLSLAPSGAAIRRALRSRAGPAGTPSILRAILRVSRARPTRCLRGA
jgi:predicted ATPase